MKKLLFAGTENSETTDIVLAMFRVFTGLSLAMAHGIKKVPPSDGFIRGTNEMGFPFPEFFAYGAGIAEFAGGLLLAIGLLTRPAAFFVAITMFVAAFIKHGDDPFGTAEKAFIYFAIALVYVILGSGRYSLDSLVRKRLKF
jgi:putative oxidoreductase